MSDRCLVATYMDEGACWTRWNELSARTLYAFWRHASHCMRHQQHWFEVES